MQTQIKRYNILLRGKVQHIGYRGIFSRVATDDYYEFSKKFDIGLDYLDGIKSDTGEMKSSLNSIDNTLGKFVIEQREHNQWMKNHSMKIDEHNQRLEKILEKLAER